MGQLQTFGGKCRTKDNRCITSPSGDCCCEDGAPPPTCADLSAETLDDFYEYELTLSGWGSCDHCNLSVLNGVFRLPFWFYTTGAFRPWGTPDVTVVKLIQFRYGPASPVLCTDPGQGDLTSLTVRLACGSHVNRHNALVSIATNGPGGVGYAFSTQWFGADVVGDLTTSVYNFTTQFNLNNTGNCSLGSVSGRLVPL